MSSNALKDQILVLLSDIIDNKKDDNLVFGDLQELLFRLKKITVFDGLKLFTDIIDGKDEFESQKIKLFLTRHLVDLSMFPFVYNYVKDQNIQIQDSIILKETKQSSELDDISVDEFEFDKLASKNEILSEPKGGFGFPKKREEFNEKETIPAPSGSRSSKKIPFSSPASKPSPPPKMAHESPIPPPSPSPQMASSSASTGRTVKQEFMKEDKKQNKDKKELKEKKKKSKKRSKVSIADINQIENEKELEEISEEEDSSISADKRNILVDYYSRMNINQVYDFTVKIDKKILEAKRKQSDFLTGEQREQITDEIEVVEELPIEIELNIPGCMVSPTRQYVSPDKSTSQVTFFVTPYVKLSKRKAQVVIGQKKLHKKTISLEVSVIDRRIMKIFSLLGVLIASVPSLWQYAFGVDMNLQLYYSLSNYTSFITQGIIVPIELGLGGLITLLSLITFKSYSSKRTSFLSTQSI